jgi:hypothetical protein
LGLSLPLGDYKDCSGDTPLPRQNAARDWCAFTGIVYLVGHNPGPFTPLLKASVGDPVRYWDPAGNPTTYRITSIHRIAAGQAPAYMTDTSRPHLVMQTCATVDATEYWEYVADPA